MLFKRKPTNEPDIPEICGCNMELDECTIVAQIRNMQMELGSLHTELRHLMSFEDTDIHIIKKFLQSYSFRRLLMILEYRTYRDDYYRLFITFIQAIRESDTNIDDFMNELNMLFCRIAEIEKKNNRIVELQKLIKQEKQKLGIQ